MHGGTHALLVDAVIKHRAGHIHRDHHRCIDALHLKAAFKQAISAAHLGQGMHIDGPRFAVALELFKARVIKQALDAVAQLGWDGSAHRSPRIATPDMSIRRGKLRIF